jgi:hypothetical protein
MASSYREFSRKRYSELKEGHGRMRESEIIQKIIREWDEIKLAKKGRQAGYELLLYSRAPEMPATPLKE